MENIPGNVTLIGLVLLAIGLMAGVFWRKIVEQLAERFWQWFCRFVGWDKKPSEAANTLHQLPYSVDLNDFTGRERQVKDLTKQLAKPGGGVAITSVEGMGGIGKTALALYVAHQIRHKYPHGQLYINLRGGGTDAYGHQVLEEPMTPVEALTRLVQAFHPDQKLPDDVDSLSGLFRSDLSGKKALLVLDNALDRDQIAPICPVGPDTRNCAVLITSRQSISLPGVTSVDLDVMDPGESRMLLRKTCKRITDDQADQIAKLCGYLPLALVLAGTNLEESKDWPVDEYIGELKKEDKRLQMLQAGDRGVTASLNLSIGRLASDMKDRWAMLTVFPGTFDIRATAAVWDIPVEEARPPMSSLVRRRLVLFDEKTERYRLHDLLRLLAKQQLDGHGHYAASMRHARHYQTVLEAAGKLYRQGRGDVLTALKMFDIEWHNISAGHAWATSVAANDNVAAQVCNAYSLTGVHCLELRLYATEIDRWLEASLDAARLLREQEAEGIHLGNRGNALFGSGQPQRAIGFYDAALVIARELGNKYLEGGNLGNLGGAYLALGQPHRALEYHFQSLAIAREIGDLRMEGNALGNIGRGYADVGQPQRAIEFHEQALSVSRKIGDRRAEGQDLGNIGQTYLILGEPQRAVDFLGQYLVIAREIGDRSGEANALGSMGNAYSLLQQPQRAIAYYQEQMTIAREIGDRGGEAGVSWNMGDEYCTLGEIRRGAELMQRCVDYKREIGHPDAEKCAAIIEERRQKSSTAAKG